MNALACLNNVLDNVEMPDMQLKGLRMVLEEKKVLLGYDTGTGKTYTFAGIVRALLNRDPTKKHILIIINDSIEQVPRDVAQLVRVPVETFNGAADSISRLRFYWERTSIFCLTLEAMRQLAVVEFLFQKLPEIESWTIDEAHHVSNWDSSDTAFMIRSLVRCIPYVIELSATPMTRESKQFYRLQNLLDRHCSPHRDETFRDRYINHYLPVNRADYDIKGKYTPTLITVDPTLDQMRPQSGIVFRHLKGTGAAPQVKALVEFVQARLQQGKRVLVYLHYHDTRQWVEQNFTEQGIQFAILHGRLRTRADRQAVLDQFRSKEVDVLITSVTESLNIEADVVVFYEFTTLVKQVIGRAHRGLQGKELEVAFVITKESDEVDYFIKYIYQRSLTIQKLLQKDYSELIAIGRQVELMQLEREGS